MAELFFPQLLSGSMVQYPLRKVRELRTIRNLLADGNLILFPDASASRFEWHLRYSGISPKDLQALQAHFDSCSGPLKSFTFMDPTGNLVRWSSDLGNSVWKCSPLIRISPVGQLAGTRPISFTLTNNAQSYQELSQTLSVPANFKYCFSLDGMSSEPTSVALFRRGRSAETMSNHCLNPNRARLSSSGSLNDGGSELTIGVSLAPGQEISISSVQLQAQASTTAYVETASQSSIYPLAHWIDQSFEAVAEGPDEFSAVVNIETAY